MSERHPLLKLALPAPRGTPLATWQDDFSTLPPDGHADFAALMHSARHGGGRILRRQLGILWPKASEHDLALAEGLGVALWLTEMLLFVKEDAQPTPMHVFPAFSADEAPMFFSGKSGIILLPRDLMQQFMVEETQLRQGKHDFALRRLSEKLAAHSMKILQGSAPLGLSAPFLLRYRLRWTMLYAGFILQAMQRAPNAPFIKPVLPPREAFTLLKNTLFVSSPNKKGGSCGSGGCSS